MPARLRRARRRRVLARAASSVGGRNRAATDGLVPLAEVAAVLGGRGSERRLGLRTGPVDAIVGTVDRTDDFDRRFLPTSSLNRQRWERIARATRRGDTLPPVELYKLGGFYFVVDGHHRISVARALGFGEVEANVIELRTRRPSDGLSVNDLPALATSARGRRSARNPAEMSGVDPSGPQASAQLGRRAG